MTNKLAGKVALITGGSRGIGAAIARRLALDGAADRIDDIDLLRNSQRGAMTWRNP